jgi:hypothetical protein
MRFVLAALIAVALYHITVAALPFGALYTLSAQCHWNPRLSTGSLGASKAPDASSNRLREACLMRRGLVGRSENVRTVLRRFPKSGELPS